MTADVVLGALTIGMSQLVGDKVVFCNAERGMLTGATPVTLPSHRTIIEVLETVALDDDIVAGCAGLVAQATGSRSTTSSGSTVPSGCSTWPPS